MADNKILNFGADVLPNETEKYYLGNSDKKWIIDASQLTGTLSEDVLPEELTKLIEDTVNAEVVSLDAEVSNDDDSGLVVTVTQVDGLIDNVAVDASNFKSAGVTLYDWDKNEYIEVDL